MEEGSVPSSTGNAGEQPTAPPATMTQSLKQLLEQCTSIGKIDRDAPPKPLTIEDKRFIECTLQSMIRVREAVQGVSTLIRAIEIMLEKGEDRATDEEAEIIDYIEGATEDLHFGDEFISKGGINLCRSLLAYPEPGVAGITCDIIANIASNNAVFQAHPDGLPLLKALLDATTKTDHSPVITKLFHGIFCIISSNEVAVEYVVTNPDFGLEYFYNKYTDEEELKNRNRIGRIIGVIFRDGNPEQLNPDNALTFVRTLVDTWWDKDTLVSQPPLVAILNLQVLYSMYNGQSTVIRQRIRELSTQILGILQEMNEDRDVEEFDENPFGTEVLQILTEFRTALESNPGPTETETPVVLSLSLCN